ncbi:MAG: hypothetical protein COT81_03410 [Candidatus Buchananbacteria bacterium CG10_big_fil_rev_8_21_14_0_10_42_9]|uniref:Bacterial Ig-like domain-containing protein n=1 Tax=Candidatus Buchananbacteria bacterium CG10_big_fil_rev_8_21_14_0_10_42_9 TaxID=1974526 RepID=A0A2H0W0Y4_9BACT|nr:MAG: hypothetical protein COT81_03410 [Candidatus Buchananbacteria bacterium CG10_big_fil_rev_8_21_14_0_10_42_9]
MFVLCYNYGDIQLMVVTLTKSLLTRLQFYFRILIFILAMSVFLYFGIRSSIVNAHTESELYITTNSPQVKLEAGTIVFSANSSQPLSGFQFILSRDGKNIVSPASSPDSFSWLSEVDVTNLSPGGYLVNGVSLNDRGNSVAASQNKYVIQINEGQIKVLPGDDFFYTSQPVKDLADQLDDSLLFNNSVFSTSQPLVFLPLPAIPNDQVLFPPMILTMDSDGDSLPDDLENLLKTNVLKADSDEDGDSDFKELQNQSNPLGADNQVLPLSLNQTILALLSLRALELPQATGLETVNYKINRVTNFTREENNYIVFSGTGRPGEVLSFFVDSHTPILGFTQVGGAGNWNYYLPNILNDGEYNATVAVLDSAGKVMQKSEPQFFTIANGRYISISEYLATTFNPSTNNSLKLQMLYFAGAIIIVAAAIMMARWFFNRRQTSLWN